MTPAHVGLLCAYGSIACCLVALVVAIAREEPGE